MVLVNPTTLTMTTDYDFPDRMRISGKVMKAQFFDTSNLVTFVTRKTISAAITTQDAIMQILSQHLVIQFIYRLVSLLSILIDAMYIGK